MYGFYGKILDMFGYININKPEIRFKDYYRFRSYYCGLCCQLKESHGQPARMALGFDMTFLVVMLSGLYDTETDTKSIRCIAHPFRKRICRVNEFSAYAADMNLLLTWLKCMDDWYDEKKISRLLYARVIGRRVKKVQSRWSKKAEVIREALSEQSRLEKENCRDIDRISACFGRIMSEIFTVRKDDIWSERLSRMGFYLGKYIYLLDAYDDVFDDEKNNCYNPFADICHEDGFDEKAGGILHLMISESAAAFEELPVVDNMDILRNIMYSGVWRSFELIKHRRSEEKKGKEEEGSQGGLEIKEKENDRSI